MSVIGRNKAGDAICGHFYAKNLLYIVFQRKRMLDAAVYLVKLQRSVHKTNANETTIARTTITFKVKRPCIFFCLTLRFSPREFKEHRE